MKKSEILFLKQEEVIQAGLLDMHQAIEVAEFTFRLLGEGQIRQPNKIFLGVPNDENWESYGMSMPAYIGGEHPVIGFKWAAESVYNSTQPGMPYGLDMVLLSDPKTMYPKAIMDGTIITAMRTSAAAGVCAKYAARKDSKVAALIGAGVIGRTMIMAICEAVPTVKTIYLCDLDLPKAEQVAKDSAGMYDVEIICTTDSKAAAAKSELIVCETTARTPFVDKSWAKPHSAIVCVSNEATQDLVMAADVKVVDYWKQMVTFKNKAIVQLHDEGKISEDEILETADLVLGKPCRTNDEQFIYACSLGLGALDITCAYAIYQRAMELGIGSKVKMWDKPLWE